MSRLFSVVLCALVAFGVSFSTDSLAIASLPDDPYSGAPAVDPSQLLGPTAPPLTAEQLGAVVEEQKRRWEGDGRGREFPDLSAGEAAQLFREVFGGAVAGLTFNPAEALEKKVGDVDGYVGDTAALVDPQGPKKHALVDSTVPLRTEDGKPVDLSLRSVGGGLEPANPLSPVSLPGALGGQAAVSGSSFGFSFPGSDRASQARPISVDGDADKEAAVYPEARTDADVALAPAPGGVEYMAQIRSTKAPERFPIEIDGEGVELKSEVGGGVSIYRGDEQVGAVSPAISVDANGKPVPTSVSVTGNRIAIEVSHRGGDFSYPILMDPIVESWDWWTDGQPSYDFSAWTPTQSAGSSYQLTNYCTGWVNDSCNGSGVGLYVNARPGYTFGAGSYGQWVYNVPWSQYGSSNNTYIAGATSNSWRYMHGTAPNTNPYGYIGTHGPGGWTQYKQYVGYGTGGSGNHLAGGPSTKQVVAGLGSAAYVTLPSGGWRYLRVAAMIITLDDGTSSDPGNPAVWGFDQGQVPAGWLNAHDDIPLSLTGADAGLGVKNIWAMSQAREGGWWVGQAISKAVENPNVTCSGLIGSHCPRVVTATPIVKAGQLANGETPVALLVTDALGKNTTGPSFTLKVDNRKPTVDLSGDAIDPVNPGVSLVIHATEPSKSGEEDGISGIEKIEVRVGDELVYSETIPCDPATDKCPAEATREIQLPYQELLKPQAEIRVDVTDHAGNGSNDADPDPYIPVNPDEEDLYVSPETGYPPATASGTCPANPRPLKPRKKAKHGGPKVLVGTVCKDIIDLSRPVFDNAVTVYGGKQDDVIRGYSGDQKIFGNAGDDRLFGGLNNDTIIGGPGNDLLVGGVGDDDLFGKAGADRMVGGHGADKFWGDSGNDYMRGGQGTDRYHGGADFDTVSFADAVPPGFDGLNGLPNGFPSPETEERGVLVNLRANPPFATNGPARLGGARDFFCIYLNSQCRGGTGTTERIIGSAFSDRIVGSGATEHLVGGSGADELIAGDDPGPGNDHLYGGPGGDVLDGSNKATVINGGVETPANNPQTNSCINTSGSPNRLHCTRSNRTVIPRQTSSITIGLVQPNEGVAGPQGIPESNVFLRGTNMADKVDINLNQAQTRVSFKIVGKGSSSWSSKGRFANQHITDAGCTFQSPTSAYCDLNSKPLGSVVVAGGSGNDHFNANGFGNNADVYLIGGLGRDYLEGSAATDILVDGDWQNSEYAEVLRGSAGEDAIITNRGKDKLFGDAGGDLLMSSATCFGDTIDGGPGRDNSQWAQLPRPQGVAKHASTVGVYIDLGLGKAGRYSNAGGANPSSPVCGQNSNRADVVRIETVEASGNPDKIVGDGNNNFFLGRSGRDRFLGRGGYDTINAREGESAQDAWEMYNMDSQIDCGSDRGQASYMRRQNPANYHEQKHVTNCDWNKKVPEIRYGGPAPNYYWEVGNPNTPTPASAGELRYGAEVDADESVAPEASLSGSWESKVTTPDALYALNDASGSVAANAVNPDEDGTYTVTDTGPGPELGVDGGLASVTDEQAVELDGDNDIVELGDGIDPAEAADGFSVETRFALTDEPSDGDVLLSREESGSGIKLFFDQGELIFESKVDGVSRSVSTYDFQPDEAWHHVVASIDGSELELVVDGVDNRVGFDVPVGPGVTPNTPLVVGADPEDADSNIAAVVDSVALYEAALEPDEILAKLADSKEHDVPEVILIEDAPTADSDGDEISDVSDNCPAASNPEQVDTDTNGSGDACDSSIDLDADGVDDSVDNCPDSWNEPQDDADSDGIGDECEEAPAEVEEEE